MMTIFMVLSRIIDDQKDIDIGAIFESMYDNKEEAQKAMERKALTYAEGIFMDQLERGIGTTCVELTKNIDGIRISEGYSGNQKIIEFYVFETKIGA